MMLSWTVLAPIVALATTIGATAAAIYATGAIRASDYRRFEDRSEAALAARFPLASMDGSPSEALYQLSKTWTGRIYDHVNAAQTRYHNAVVSSSACLAMAFAALAISTVSEKSWRSPGGLTWPTFELLLSWTEAWGLAGVLALFLYGRLSNRPWINRRAAAELIRQYQFLSILFPKRDPDGAVEQRLGREAAVVNALVRDGALTGVGERAAAYWAARRADLASRPMAEADLSPDALLLFLRRRARRQLIWFSDAKARLEHIADRRAHVLMVLYCLALGLAVLKHVLLLAKVDAPAPLLPLLLIVTGVSGAMTAYYFNQNARSLIHRYNTQQRFIFRWLTRFKESWDFADAPVAPVVGAEKSSIRAQILEFEDLMIEELIDWAHISTHDAIELAP